MTRQGSLEAKRSPIPLFRALGPFFDRSHVKRYGWLKDATGNGVDPGGTMRVIHGLF